MKKFQFSLDTVLQYKQQRLDALKADITYPEKADYLKDFRLSYIKAPNALDISAGNSAGKSKSVSKFLDGSPVLVMAEKGEYSCVLDMTKYVAGWVQTQYLDDAYYGEGNALTLPLRKELESWSDIETLYDIGGTIVGIKKDGSTVFAPYGDNGYEGKNVNLSNWGKLKTLRSFGPVVYGITEKGEVRIYSHTPDWYPTEGGEVLQWREENNIRLTDCRYASKVSDVIGNLNMGLMILADGRLSGMSPRGMISEKGTEEYQDILYFDDGEKNWCYLHVSIGDDGSVVRTLYVRENNGSFKTDGRDVSKEEAYEFQNLVKDIAAVAGEYPNQAFTALRENGSLVFCGLNAVEIAGFDDQKKTFSMSPTASLLPFQGQIRALVSSGLFLNSEDRLVSLSGLAANAGQVELDGLHPETFKNWREIQSACLSVYGDLFAVTSDGKVLVDINEDAGCQDMGQYDVEGWKNVHCITSGGYNMESCAYTLGVTGEGKVLIAGVLPGEAA